MSSAVRTNRKPGKATTSISADALTKDTAHPVTKASKPEDLEAYYRAQESQKDEAILAAEAVRATKAATCVAGELLIARKLKAELRKQERENRQDRHKAMQKFAFMEQSTILPRPTASSGMKSTTGTGRPFEDSAKSHLATKPDSSVSNKAKGDASISKKSAISQSQAGANKAAGDDLFSQLPGRATAVNEKDPALPYYTDCMPANFNTPLMTSAIDKQDAIAASVRRLPPSKWRYDFGRLASELYEKNLNFELLGERTNGFAPYIRGTADAEGSASSSKTKGDSKSKFVTTAAVSSGHVNEKAEKGEKGENAKGKDLGSKDSDKEVVPANGAFSTNSNTVTARSPPTLRFATNSNHARKEAKRMMVAREVEDEWINLKPNSAAAELLAFNADRAKAKNGGNVGVSAGVKKRETVSADQVGGVGEDWEVIGGDEEYDFCT